MKENFDFQPSDGHGAQVFQADEISSEERFFTLRPARDPCYEASVIDLFWTSQPSASVVLAKPRSIKQTIDDAGVGKRYARTAVSRAQVSRRG